MNEYPKALYIGHKVFGCTQVFRSTAWMGVAENAEEESEMKKAGFVETSAEALKEPKKRGRPPKEETKED